MSSTYAITLRIDHNKPENHIAIWASPELYTNGSVANTQDVLGTEVDVWVFACRGNRLITLKLESDSDSTCLVSFMSELGGASPAYITFSRGHGLSTLNQSSMMANAGSVATGIGGSCLSSPIPRLFIGIVNHQVDKDLNIEIIAREAEIFEVDLSFHAGISDRTASIHVDINGKLATISNTGQADVMAWRAAQKRQWQGLQMTGSKTVAESPHELQSLIEKLPGLVGSIDWDAPAGDGVTAGAEWIGSVKWPLTATCSSVAAGVAAIASHLIARGYFLSYEVCGNAVRNGCDTTVMFSFSETGRVGSEAFDAPRDWKSAVATLDQEHASGQVKAGLLQRNPEGIKSCDSKRRLSLGEFRDVLSADIDAISDIITELGDSSTTSFKVGDRVVVSCVGHPIQERNFEEALGVGCDGGYAEYALAPGKNVVKIPGQVDFAEAAVATDSVATAYHAIVAEGRVCESHKVGVIGLGGLGLNGLAIVAHRGARVFGVDINVDKFEQAEEYGAIACATD
ncbi:hypothetical protein SGCOL_007569 [Colletotrichum sp. CLE4]